jgi:hypothetical protein
MQKTVIVKVADGGWFRLLQQGQQLQRARRRQRSSFDGSHFGYRRCE